MANEKEVFDLIEHFDSAFQIPISVDLEDGRKAIFNKMKPSFQIRALEVGGADKINELSLSEDNKAREIGLMMLGYCLLEDYKSFDGFEDYYNAIGFNVERTAEIMLIVSEIVQRSLKDRGQESPEIIEKIKKASKKGQAKKPGKKKGGPR